MNRTIYLSERDIPLVYYGEPPPKSKFYLTVENYLKWYHIYRITPEGKVRILPEHFSRKFEAENEGCCAWGDHIPFPQFCAWLTKFPNNIWCDQSLELIIGRWILEGRSLAAISELVPKDSV